MDKNLQDKTNNLIKMLFDENNKLIQKHKVISDAFQYVCEFLLDHPPADAGYDAELLSLCVESSKMRHSDNEEIKSRAWEVYGSYFIKKSIKKNKETSN